MKVTLSIAAETVNELQGAAQTAGCSSSVLADLLLRRGLAALVPERLRAKVDAERAKSEGPRLTESERHVLAALGSPEDRPSVAVIVARAGYSRGIVLRALQRLRGLGLIGAESVPKEDPDADLEAAPAGPRLTPSEQRVLDTVPAEGRIPTVSIMARAGCGYTIAVRALRRLTALQLITGDLLPGKELGGEDDRERRMCWWREGVKP